MMTSNEQKQSNEAPTPELPDELVSDILTRLPVKSLLRFKCISKAWCATISDPSFIRRHLKMSAACRWEQNPPFLITRHSLDYDGKGDIGFCQWQQGTSEAWLVHSRDCTSYFNLVLFFPHCDGLVLVPTDTTAYLFNPATRDIVTLPESSHGIVPPSLRPIGFGHDLRSGMYKVVQFFLRSRDDEFYNGVEVCTVGDPAPPQWREIMADRWYTADPWVTAQSVNGGVYWIVHVDNYTGLEPHPRCLLRFGLDDEALSHIHLPSELSDPEDDDNNVDKSFKLSVLQGELCLTAYRARGHRLMVVWALVEDEASFVWEPRHTLNGMDPCHPIAFLPGTLLLWFYGKLCIYDLRSRELTNVCDFSWLRYRSHGSGELEPAWNSLPFFDVIPYTESLVPVGAHPA
ncbi:hypothetical protein CFC21_039320 [Triticum aestivum]|uniref:F-box domain-containing protein n=2 Tax=Triticum aestivum TaxID=4565 RepID=A0A3B6FI77_WHEAT|nr:hypothetical protein CFC21_039320 [Triticum aestivum]